MVSKYYKEGDGGTDSGTITNPYASLTTLNAGLLFGDRAYCAGTATLAATYVAVAGVTYRQWPGEAAWNIDGNSAADRCFYATGNVALHDLECYGAVISGVTFRSTEAGETFTATNVTSRNHGSSGFLAHGQSSGAVGIYRCTATANTDYGIHDLDQTGGAFTTDNCDIYGNGGGQEFYLSGCTGGSQLVTRCKIHTGTGHGISVSSSSTSGAIEISRNIFYGLSGAVKYAVSCSASASIVGNAVYGCNRGLLVVGAAVVVKNNALSSTTSRPMVVDSAATTGFDSDNNCFHSFGADFTYDGSDYATLALYQAGSSQDANSIDSDPLFTDPDNDDFTPQVGSPCINRGVFVDDVETTDADGNAQSVMADIGAYNYVRTDIPDTTTFYWSGNVNSATDITIVKVPTGHMVLISGISLHTGSNTTVDIKVGSDTIVDESYGASPIQVNMPIAGAEGEDISIVGGGSGSEGYVVLSGEFVNVSEVVKAT